MLLQRFFDSPRLYQVLFAVLLLPALLLNLDAHHIFVHTDEGRRALVALEMMLKDEYLAPTLNGVFYYEKPPLFNWLLALSFKAFGNYSLFAFRFPVVVFVLLFAVSIVMMLKPVMGTKKAWAVMVASIACGRILFYDSFLGLMDIGLGLLVFVNFMLFFRLGRDRRYFLLFAATYSIMAVGYLMKGLPSVVFQFFTIIAWAIYIRDWKFIFHKYNFVGTLFFLVPVGLYYYFYLQVNPDSFATMVEYTIHQSSQRTVTDYGIWPTIVAILKFPFDNLYHFAPWTILLFALFSKKARRTVWQNDFTRFALIAIALNIWVYWTSPGNQPRYLFAFVPLIFAAAVEAYSVLAAKGKKTIEYSLLVVMALLVLLPIVLMFMPERLPSLHMQTFKLLLLSMAMAFCVKKYWEHPAQRLLLLGVFLLVVRIGFNWFVLPFKDEQGRIWMQKAIEVTTIVGENELYVLAPNYCHNGTSFVISSMRGQVLRVAQEPEQGVYYIMDDVSYDHDRFVSLLNFGTRGTQRTLHLVRLKEGA
jgi:4-amino-4-deoxy-L-arabinose transferase-like glycosyltransferase